jgi:hypothetical protein
MKMSLDGGPAAGVGEGDAVWAAATTQLDKLKQTKNTVLAMLLLIVGILGLSYNTPLTLYQGRSAKLPTRALARAALPV